MSGVTTATMERTRDVATKTLRANVFHGKDGFRVEEVSRPTGAAGEAVLRFTLTTICGTDLHIVRGEYPVKPGLIIEHEAVGVIEELGAFTLDDIQKAYHLFGERLDGVMKVAITP